MHRVRTGAEDLDGNPALKLASFVTPWMEPLAGMLTAETLGKNMIDQDEYRSSPRRCLCNA